MDMVEVLVDIRRHGGDSSDWGFSVSFSRAGDLCGFVKSSTNTPTWGAIGGQSPSRQVRRIVQFLRGLRTLPRLTSVIDTRG